MNRGRVEATAWQIACQWEDARDSVEIYMVIICVFVKILLFI